MLAQQNYQGIIRINRSDNIQPLTGWSETVYKIIKNTAVRLLLCKVTQEVWSAWGRE